MPSSARATSCSRRPRPTRAGGRTCSAATRTCARRTRSRPRATSRPARAGCSSASPARRSGSRRSPTRPRGARAGRRSRPSDFEADGAWIDYRGGPGTIRTVSFSDLSGGRVDPAVFRGKIVVVGATSPALQDVHATPGRERRPHVRPGDPGQRDLDRDARLPLRTAPLWFDILAIIALAMAPAFAGLRARPLAVALVAPLVGVFWLILAQLAFGAGWIVAVVWPLAALLMGTTGTIAARYLAELAERRRVTRLQRGARAPRPRAHRGAARDPARGRPPARAGGRVARRRHRRAHRAHEPPLRAPRAPRSAGASPTPSCSATRARCTTSARSASPTACCSSRASSTAEEREIMKRHASIGALDALRLARPSCSSSPSRSPARTTSAGTAPATRRGLRGEEIPLAGRICAVCDVYDALVSPRPYKEPWSQSRRARGDRRAARPPLRPAARRGVPRLLWPEDVRAVARAPRRTLATAARARSSALDAGTL